jgi:hypothetical protein
MMADETCGAEKKRWTMPNSAAKNDPDESAIHSTSSADRRKCPVEGSAYG